MVVGNKKIGVIRCVNLRAPRVSIKGFPDDQI